ncbi:MAG: Cyclohexadienyl dehydrogenase(EC, partial [uncultured Sphingomonas sp.]
RRPGGGVARGGAEIRRVGLPRLHPHRGQRRGHVARHLPQQPRSAAGDAGPLHGGRAGAGARRALGRVGVHRGPHPAGAAHPAGADRAEAGV